ncbi:MAG: ATPase [Oscillospiraceae bacterium]
MAVDKYLDQIDDVLEEAWSLPLSGGKRMVDIDKIRNLIDEIRLHLPDEIKQAKAVVADRDEIIRDAKAQSEEIIKKAEDRARILVSEEEILKSAKAKSDEIMNETRQKSKAAERAALEFSEAVLSKSENALMTAYNEVKNTRVSLRNNGSGTNK